MQLSLPANLAPEPPAPGSVDRRYHPARGGLDASPCVAFVLPLAIAAEAALRLWTRREEAPRDPAQATPGS